MAAVAAGFTFGELLEKTPSSQVSWPLVGPAPKSRFVVFDLSRVKIKIKSQNKGVRRSRFSVAVRLAGGSDLKDATAGKPDCYR